MQLWMVCDGEIDEDIRQNARVVLPQAKFFTIKEIVELTGYNPPELKICPLFSSKLGLILGLQSHFDLVYCDFDVLAFNRPTELIKGIELCDAVQYMVETHMIIPDLAYTAKTKSCGFTFDARLNAGFLHLPKNSLNLSLAMELLKMWDGQQPPVLLEQLIIATLVGCVKSKILNPKHYLITGKRMFWYDSDIEYSKIVCRHFTNPVRHVMYLKGLPYLHSSVLVS